MTIDASIPLGVKPVQIDSPTNALAQMFQIKAAQQTGQMADMTMQEKQRGMEESNQLRKLFASPDFDMASPASMKQVMGISPTQGMAFQKSQLETRKAQGDIDSTALTTASKRHSLFQNTLGALAYSPNLTRDSVTQAIQGLVQGGILPPEAMEKSMANMPDDPVALRARLLEGVHAQLTPEQLMAAFTPKPTQINNGQQISFRDTNPNSPTYGQATGGAPVQLQQTPDGVAGRAQQEQSSIRSDSRARDLNETRVEDNRIKREAKDDAAKLTKSGQVASFDTMLGTLDRLSTHPGLSNSVGMMSKIPTMPGSDSANFQAELNTFQSQAFIPMVSQLKGMGALSDAEGKKLTAAVGALDPKMGETAFRASISRITADMAAARERVVGGGRTALAPAAPVNLNNMTPDQRKQVTAQAEKQFNIRPQKMPAAGDVEGGFRFKGGNASNPANWVRQ